MVIPTERDEAAARLVAALRGTFDASVMNFGSYNILYAANRCGGPVQSGTGQQEQAGGSAQLRVASAPHLLVGYRRHPVELVLCPVDLSEALPRAAEGNGGEPVPAVPVTVNLTNLAGLATEGDDVEITFSTGHRVSLRLCGSAEFQDLPGVRLHQERDVEDFYDFIDFFMDTVEAQGG